MDTSYIEVHEEEEAKRLIDEEYTKLTGGPCTLRPCGYLIAVKIWVTPDELSVIKMPDGSTKTLYSPHLTQDQDKYRSVSALVVAVGHDAYKGNNPDGTPRYRSPWCKVGDWVVVPRHECYQITFKKSVAMGILPDDRILSVIEDPTDVAATT
jgi:co-chaperonin GroES (HSP10)